jgi:hypothetical protein
VEGEELQALKKANPNNRGRMRFMRLFFWRTVGKYKGLNKLTILFDVSSVQNWAELEQERKQA